MPAGKSVRVRLKENKNSGGYVAVADRVITTGVAKTPLNRQQILGFWSAWLGWLLDGMNSVIFVLVLTPSLTELLPKSGMQATPGEIARVGGRKTFVTLLLR